MRVLLSHVIVIAIAFCVEGCASSSPDWFSAIELPDYSRDLYIGAAGTGKTYDEALTNAQAAIAAQIQVSLKSSITSSIKEIISEDISEYSEVTERTAHSFVEGQLRAIEVVRKAKKDRVCYIYAVLNKRYFVAAIKIEMDLLLSQMNEAVSLSRSLLLKGHFIAAMENYLAAREHLVEFISKHDLFIAFSDEQYFNSREISSIDLLESEIREKLNSVRLEVVSGDNQSVVPGRELPEPIVLCASYRAFDGSGIIPLRKFPFEVKSVASGRKRHVTNDINGKVVLHHMADGGLGRHQLIIKPQVDRIPEYFRSQILELEAVAYYNVVPANGPQFSVKVYSNAGMRLPDVEATIVRTVTNNGYAVSIDAPLILLGKFADPETKEIQQLSGPLFIAISELTIELIVIATQEVLGSTSVKGQGSATNVTEAISKSVKNIRLEKVAFKNLLRQEAWK